MQDTRTEIRNVINQLKSQIKELQSISGSLRHDFKGIGTSKCADSVDSVIRQYNKIIEKLERV